MRLVVLLAAFLLAAPVAAATGLVPERWSAAGRADGVCAGDVRAEAIGPIPVGPRAGQYRLRVELVPDSDACAPIVREGYIATPRADIRQTLAGDEHGGTIVSFVTGASGARTLELYEWSEDADGLHESAIVSVIAERYGYI